MMTLTAYASRRGVSPKAVSKAVAAGRLTASVTRDQHGAPKIADPDLADREWEANTRQRADWTGPRAAPAPEELAADDEPQPTAPPTTRGRVAPLPDGVPPYNVSQAIRAQAAARREIAAAKRAELELAELQGRLVDAAESESEVAAHISMAKARLLGVPTQLGQQLPHLALEVVPVAERLVRAALEELSLDGLA